MAVERAPVAVSLMDVLDRVLGKGVVVETRPGVGPVGIELAGAGARLVVVSVGTYLGQEARSGRAGRLARLRVSSGAPAGQGAGTGGGELRTRLEG